MAFWTNSHRHKKSNLINPPLHNQVVEISDYSIWRLIGEIRNLQTSNNYRYAEYDIMAQDTVIKAALQLYADFAVQINDESGLILDISSDNEILAKDISAFLKKFDIENKLWKTAYQTAKYGDSYWKVLLTDDNKDIGSIETIDDPSSVVDLYLHGKPAYYGYNPDDRSINKSMDYNLFSHDSFVHFLIASGETYDTIEIPSETEFDEVTGRQLVVTYKIHTGESMIEGVRSIYRILKALEDSVIAASISRADYSKIYNIEVGPDTNEIDARKIVNKVKRLFDSRMALDVREGQESASTYKQPRSFMDPVFNSVSGGKGAISIETDGGTIEVGDLNHIDYFNKLKFSGLHITPSMLAFEENISNGLGDKFNSMIYQDIRLAMYIKKLIVSILNGITDLVNIWLKVHNRNNEIGKFTITMAVPSSAESMANLSELSQTLEYVDKLGEVIAKNAPGINSAKVTEVLLDEYVQNKTLLDKLKPIINEATKVAEMEQELAKSEIESALSQFDTLLSTTPEEFVDISPGSPSQQPSPTKEIPKEVLNSLLDQGVPKEYITYLRIGNLSKVPTEVLKLVAQELSNLSQVNEENALNNDYQ